MLGNIINNGVIYADVTHTSSLIVMNGATQQSITGSGVWSIIGSGTGRFAGFGVYNTSGASPAVVLTAPQNLAVANQLSLANGSIGGIGNIHL